MPRPTPDYQCADLFLFAVRMDVFVRVYDSDGILLTVKPEEAKQLLQGLALLGIFPSADPEDIRGAVTAACSQVAWEVSADDVEKMVRIVLEIDDDDSDLADWWKEGGSPECD